LKERWNLPFWIGGVAGPYKHAPPHVRYDTKFGRSRSNHLGVGMGPKIFGHAGAGR